MNRNLLGKSLLFISLFLLFSTLIFGQQVVQGNKVFPVKTAVVNFKELSDKELLMPRNWLLAAPIPNEGREFEEPYSATAPQINPSPTNPTNPLVVSPSPLLSYEAAPDEAQGGGASGTYNIPPDTHGAVGLDKVFVNLNNNYKVLDKATGAQLSLVSMPSFWSALGADATGAFDPRIMFDPYNNRWIVAAVSNGSSANSRVLLAISQTWDPMGNYNLYAFDPDTGATDWADFPMLGFNKNWVAIGVNNFTLAGTFTVGKMFVIDYPTILTGTANATVFSGTAFCTHPATTYSASEPTLYSVNHIGSGAATYAMNTITGTPAAPVFTLGGTKVRTGGGWVAPSGNIEPQQCLSTCPGVIASLDASDAYIRHNVIFRNGFVWYAQTVSLPIGTYTHTGVQWTKLTAATGNYADGGRVEDATATSSNGGQWYAYPSIAVNKNDDVLLGYSKFESDGYAGAAYSFRLGTDAPGTMQDVVIYKDGLDYYDKNFGGTRQRWGDYSHTMVDPYDSVSLWTIQEYAKLRAAPSVGGSTSKWGTWWAQVMPNQCNANVASGNWSAAATWGCGHVPTATDNIVIQSGQNVTLDVDPLAASITVNNGGTLTVNTTRSLSCNLLVNGTLNITGGKLQLGAYNVFLDRVGTLTGASSTSYFVTNGIGAVRKAITAGTNFQFPVAATTSSYTPLTIALNAGDPTELFNVRVSTGVNPTAFDAATCVQRTWNIAETTPGGNNATLTFQWTAAEHGASFNPAVAATANRHNGVSWVLGAAMPIPSLAAGVYTAATSTTVSSFSPWVISSIGVIPVRLEYFTGKKQGNANWLNWKVTCLSDQAKFNIERSTDGRNFISIGNLTATNTRCLQPFDFTDNNPASGINYYRIKMTDADGKFVYTQVLALLNNRNGFEVVNISPSLVVDGKAILNLSSAQAQQVNIVVTGAAGNILNQFSQVLIAGATQVPMDFSTLGAGTYWVSVYTADRVKKSVRFVKY